MSKKHKDLQPLLNYFDMLHTYEQKGFLQLDPPKHEAYVTQPALHALTPGTDPLEQLRDGTLLDAARRLRTYAAFLSTEGKAYPERPFAIHVVKDEPPHYLIYTMVMERQHSWLRPWRYTEHIETVTY